jgi:hypothetical protein
VEASRIFESPRCTKRAVIGCQRQLEHLGCRECEVPSKRIEKSEWRALRSSVEAISSGNLNTAGTYRDSNLLGDEPNRPCFGSALLPRSHAGRGVAPNTVTRLIQTHVRMESFQDASSRPIGTSFNFLPHPHECLMQLGVEYLDRPPVHESRIVLVGQAARFSGA